MTTLHRFKQTLALTAAFTAMAHLTAAAAETSSYYKNPKLFSTRPLEKQSLTTITRFGPVGMGIDLIQPAFTMRIKNIEDGSPAAATGKLKKGQIIESINGQKLADIDPRVQLAQMLAKAEASDGNLTFAIKGEKEAVTVKLPVLGAYSKTWPENCPKSKKIITRFADYLSKPDADPGRFGMGMLFLLSTGDDKYLPVVKKWAHGVADSNYAWALGYAGLPLCEYYLRTGDQDILPKIQKWVDLAVAGQYNDSWAGRGGVPRVTYGMGHLNAAATGVLTFMLLAKECGVEVPDHALQGALRHFYRYVGRGGNPYGDDHPEVGFVDNGKNGLLAFAMAAAANLDPDGEKSIYAVARDVCAVQSFYTASFMLHGHTGGGIGELWRSPVMGLLKDKKPKQYRDFMDSRQWHYELSRRWDGSFGILGGAGYDKVDWGAGYGLAYTVPLKTLRLTGAPPSKFSKSYHLPDRPWGTAADEQFVTLEAVPFADGKKQDLSGETLAKDSSLQFIRWFHDAEKQPSDDEVWKYLHHQSHNIRFIAANKILGVNSGYIGWRAPGGELRPGLFAKALRSDSPRVRRAMFAALAVTLEKEKPEGLLTRETFELMIKSLKNPEESWYVKDAALSVVGLAPSDWVVPHVDSLIPFLKHEEAWLRSGALTALTPVVADPRTYQKVIPAVGELIRTNQRASVTLGMQAPLRAQINAAPPEVQKLAKEVLKESYIDYAGEKSAPGGQDISSTVDAHLEYIAGSLADVPGGLDVLYEIARTRYPNEILPYKQFFLDADPKQFGPVLRKAIKPIILDELIPAYVDKNRSKLERLARLEVQSSFPGGPQDVIDGLTHLYDRAGDDSYNWKVFADIRLAEWWYHSFDPIPSEQVPFDNLIERYRKVTLPKGMEDWNQLGFDPAAAGWKKGQAPFGNYLGKLPQGKVSKCLKSYSHDCTGPYCFGALPDNTLWEKEVLLLRQKFKIPPLQDGHRYRIRVNGSDHVGTGGGYGIWINGKQLIENPKGTGRGGGEKPKGAFITKEFLNEFKGGQVTIAIKSFLRYNDKYKTHPTKKEPQGRISLHLEEQKLPPMGDNLIRQSATAVPMMRSKRQAKSDQKDPKLVQPTLMAQCDAPIRDNAILQQKIKLPVSGRSLPGAKVTVSFDGQIQTATADNHGRWRVVLEAMEAVRLKSVNDCPAGKSMTIVCEKNHHKAIKVIKNLVLGDVWLCAGQSNMAGALRTNKTRHHPQDTVEKAHYPALRQYRSGQDQEWVICSPETAPVFKKVAFFFGRRLQQDALVPIGLISAAVGGSNIESWLNQKPYQTGKNYTKLIEPIIGFGLRGTIWYQGESNAKDRREYEPKLKSLITGWRKVWGQGDFPFYYVQLPGIGTSTLDNPAGGDGRAEIRQAYVETLALENTGLAVTIDVGAKSEHPPNKYDTGVRLARLALHHDYGFNNLAICPLYKSHVIEGRAIRVSFAHADNGLMVAEKVGFATPMPTPDAKLQWLSIQAKDGAWHWADGQIDGSDLVVSAPHVAEPVAVRYAYTQHPNGKLLYNKDGQPVSPFSTIGYGPEIVPQPEKKSGRSKQKTK